MIPFGWQDVAAVLLVLAAAAYLWRRIRRRVARMDRPGCQACPSCRTPRSDRPLIPLDPPSSSISQGAGRARRTS